MSFSTKTEYGLVALIELAEVYSGGGVLQAGEIARRQGIPERYLEQMLTSLRRGGILHSIRGPKGGYQLARPPADISVANVVACLEGSAHESSEGRRQTPEFAVLHDLDQQLEVARQSLLQSTTLETLIAQRNRKMGESTMYFI